MLLSNYDRTLPPAMDYPRVGSCVLPPEEAIFGKTPKLAGIRDLVYKAAPTDLPLLITGKSGAGKTTIAQLIHSRSRLAGSAFVHLNCAAVPRDQLESELFGMDDGSLAIRTGRVEAASEGTLFIEEITELTPAAQARLLLLLQDGTINRVGGQEELKLNVRLIFATTHDLEKETLSGAFREDLFYRINVVSIHMPTLSERTEDIPALAHFFLQKYNAQHDRRTAPLSGAAIRRMQQYEWPGNLRELENLIKRYVILGTEESILSELVKDNVSVFRLSLPRGAPVSLKQIKREAVRQIEHEVILNAVEVNGGSRKKAARLLNISYRGLLYKLKELGVASQRRRNRI